MNIRFPLIIVIIALNAVLFSSCWTTSKFLDRVTLDTSKVPKDFDPRKQTLLICEIYRLNAPKQVSKEKTEKFDKLLQKYYPYKYEIVSREDIISKKSKYSDTSKYKYGLLYYLNGVTHSTTTTTTTRVSGATYSNSVSPSARTIYVDFGFYDRNAAKTYPATGNWAPKLEYGVAAFASLVEKARQGRK